MNKKELKKLALKFANGLADYMGSIDYKIKQERDAIAEHEENIRSLESQRVKPL